MDVSLVSGRYVVAVSGGVDSVVLLHLLQERPELQLTVAHFNHGIRPDAAEDRKLVAAVAREYRLPFAYDEGRLGPAASEDMARRARYRFLRQVQAASGARAIVTAHHQDDVLETAILNLLRGTGRKGLTSLTNRPGVIRPLLAVPKNDIRTFAAAQGLRWREDSTNDDLRYARNYIRHRLLPRFDAAARQKLWEIICRQQAINDELDTALLNQLHVQPAPDRLSRRYFVQLPHPVAREVLAGWLRAHGVRDFDRRTLERLTISAKVMAPGKQLDVLNGYVIAVAGEHLALLGPER